MSQKYKVNAPNVVYEVIEGEAVIVNLKKGYYYSMQDCGPDILDAIAKGLTVSEITQYLTQCYITSPAQAESIVRTVLEQLEKEELISKLTDESKAAIQDVNLRTPATKTAIKAPVLQKYTDMENVLLLDPIHDVDQKGWPAKL